MGTSFVTLSSFQLHSLAGGLVHVKIPSQECESISYLSIYTVLT